MDTIMLNREMHSERAESALSQCNSRAFDEMKEECPSVNRMILSWTVQHQSYVSFCPPVLQSPVMAVYPLHPFSDISSNPSNPQTLQPPTSNINIKSQVDNPTERTTEPTRKYIPFPTVTHGMAVY